MLRRKTTYGVAYGKHSGIVQKEVRPSYYKYLYSEEWHEDYAFDDFLDELD